MPRRSSRRYPARTFDDFFRRALHRWDDFAQICFGVLLPDFDDMIHAAAKLGAIKRLNEGFSNCGYPRETVANVTQRGIRIRFMESDQ